MKNKIKRLEALIDMLQNDIECFGAGGDDLSRLASYKKELKELNI